MPSPLSSLFDTSGFMPRWKCGTWSDGLGYLHIFSDIAIFGAYTAIPLVIAYFVLRRRDVPFPKIFWLFVIFIFACGTTHLIEAIIFWHPIYRFDGWVKLVTAVASWSTVVALAFATPQALRLPGLARLNTELTHEVQERRQAESALRQSEEQLRAGEERLRLALLAGKMGTWVWDTTTGMVTSFENNEQIHGRQPRVARAPLDDVLADIHPDDQARVRAQIQESARDSSEFHVEYRVVIPNADLRWLEARGQIFRGQQPGDSRMFGVCVDITARKRAEAEREELLISERAARGESERANRLKDEFLSIVSHELRTPLSAILGYAQLLRGGQIPSSESQDALAAIERNCRAQVQIIDDLLDMSRIIAGKIRLDVRSVHLQEIIHAAIDTISPAVEAKGIRLQQVLDPRAAPVLGDFDRLQQVLSNMLSNAVKFTPKGGRIQVALERVNSHLEISIADTGQGIHADFLPYVFDRFRQEENATSRRHGGLGLGLAIVKQIVELHGGTVRAKSPGENRGSTFTIVLPLQVLPHDEAERIHPRAEISLGDSNVTVDLTGVKALIVDDEPDTREVVRRFLQNRNAEVAVAATADEALSMFASFRPNVLLSDIGMPGKDGYQFIREVRAMPAGDGGAVPAVALTAFARTEDRRRALMAGYQSHVAKPVDAGELIAVIAMLTGRTAT